MKKILVVLCVAGFIVSIASPLMAGGIVNKQNFSSEYLRTFSRNAATDAADVMVFNPAGVMKMEDGFYGNLAIFYADKDYSNTIPGLGELDSKEPSIIPGLFALYRQDKWAGFFAFTIPGGGGMVNYKDGSATTLGMAQGIILSGLTPFDTYESSSIEANSFYYGYTIGGAYTINDLVSVSAGLRFVDAFKEADATAVLSVGGLGATPINVEFEQTANGWGGFFGVNYTPREDLNFGFRYETATELDFKTNIKNDDTNGLGGTIDPRLIDGNKIREDLPGLIGLGAAYKVKPNIKLDFSLTYYLEESATWDSGIEADGNSWDLAIAAEYTFNPQLRGSLGYMLTKTGIDADDMTPENPELGANTLSAGVAWEPMDNMTLNFAMLNSFYVSDKTSTGIKYEQNIFGLGFGIEYKFK